MRRAPPVGLGVTVEVDGDRLRVAGFATESAARDQLLLVGDLVGRIGPQPATPAAWAAATAAMQPGQAVVLTFARAGQTQRRTIHAGFTVD